MNGASPVRYPMPTLYRVIWLPCVVCLLAACGREADHTVDEPASISAQLERHRYNDAARSFSAHLESDPHDRSALFGRAAALIGAQPRTEDRFLEAMELLKKVVTGDPDDELGIAAAYLHARILQRHLATPRTDEAKAAFLALFERQPSHPLAQYGLVKFATMEIFLRPDGDLPPRVLARLEALAVQLNDPSAIRSFHHVMGQAYQMFGLSEADALRHYRRALDIGFAKENLQVDIRLRVAELSRKTGDHALARQHYHAFLAAHPRERRAHLVREILDQLDP